MKHILSILTGSGGDLSSKRVALFIFAFAFLGEHVAWYGWRIAPQPTLCDQLYYTLTTLVAAVFGEGVVAIWKRFTGNATSDPNALKQN